MEHRTRAYWPTRIVLIAVFIATAVAVLAGPALMSEQPCPGCGDPNVLGLRPSMWLAVSMVVFVVLGLVWAARYFRGWRGDP